MAGTSLLDSQLLTGLIQISAPTETPSNPLTPLFTLDASVIPAGQDQSTTEVLKNGTVVPDCTGASGIASPDPCISNRTLLDNGAVQLTVLTSSAREWAFTVPPCGPSPMLGCQSAASKEAQLHLTTKGKLKWKWTSSAAVATSDFGSPPTTTYYAFCMYGASGAKLAAKVQPGGTCGTKPCWRTKAGRGFRFGDKTGTPNGVTGITLSAGDAGKAKIQMKGATANLLVPALPLAAPVRAQLHRMDTGACWEAVYSTPLRNNRTTFSAKSD
jgi:hypothetical protein